MTDHNNISSRVLNVLHSNKLGEQNIASNKQVKRQVTSQSQMWHPPSAISEQQEH